MTDDSPQADPTSTKLRRPFWIAVAIAIFVIIADQVSKWWAIENLSDGQTIPVIGDFIRFWLVYNPGAAFGLGTGYAWILAIIAGAAAVAVSAQHRVDVLVPVQEGGVAMGRVRHVRCGLVRELAQARRSSSRFASI